MDTVRHAAPDRKWIAHHVGSTRLPLPEWDGAAPPAVAILLFEAISIPAFRTVLSAIRREWPGVPTLVLTAMYAVNLIHLKDVVVTEVLDRGQLPFELARRISALAGSADRRALAVVLRQADNLARPCREALAVALESERAISTVRGLGQRAGITEQTLRRRYKPIATATGVSLRDFLHAVALFDVASERERGASFKLACIATGIDPRTASVSVARLGGGSAAGITADAAGYRRWFEIRVLGSILAYEDSPRHSPCPPSRLASAFVHC